MVTTILKNLENVRFLLPALLTCRHIYACFTQNPTLVADILHQQVTPGLVPYAVAVFESSRLDPRTETTVTELLATLYTQRAKLVNQLRTTPLRQLA
ncbi:hypothetical protein IMZ48_26845 [Candidatus Bathyarchaeota archaeon]|nr:hypothetical protein [Candidatus Bathyarchaeota archaeon]